MNLKHNSRPGRRFIAVVLNGAGQAWRTDTRVFEPPTAGDWADYAVAMTEQSTTGVYAGNFPTAITAAGTYAILFRQQSGGSPAATDQNNGMLGGLLFWTGAAEAFALASSAANAANVGMNGLNLNANVLQIAGQTASAAGGVTFPASIGTSTFSGGNVNVMQIGGQAVSLELQQFSQGGRSRLGRRGGIAQRWIAERACRQCRQRQTGRSRSTKTPAGRTTCDTWIAPVTASRERTC